MSTNELALAIHRKTLNIPGSNGIFEVDFSTIDQYAYALLPRHIANNKSVESIGLGAAYPQLASYATIKTSKGKILSYARKGKEEGLHGLRSIGIGGHITQRDICEIVSEQEDPDYFPTILECLSLGIKRELEEEVGISVAEDVVINQVVVSTANLVSAVHIGLLSTFTVEGHKELVYDEAELLDVQWLSVKQLKDNIHLYEPWSQELIRNL